MPVTNTEAVILLLVGIVSVILIVLAEKLINEREKNRKLQCVVDDKDVMIKELRGVIDNRDGEIKSLRREMAGLDERNERLMKDNQDAAKALTVMLSVQEKRQIETPIFDDTVVLERLGATGVLAQVESNRAHPEKRVPRPARATAPAKTVKQAQVRQVRGKS